MPKRKSWLERYHDYERRCVKASSQKDGKKKTARFKQLNAEYQQLKTERPDLYRTDDAPRDCISDTLRRMKDIVAQMFTDQVLRVRDWPEVDACDDWLNTGFEGEPPPTANPDLLTGMKLLTWYRQGEQAGKTDDKSIQRQRFDFECEWKRTHAAFNSRKPDQRHDFLEAYNERNPGDS